MPNQIDFLPARYREQDVRRRSRLWLLSILGFFVCVIAATYAVQSAFRKQAESQLAAVEFPHASAKATQEMYNRLQSRLSVAQASASLYAYLESSWPRTQIVLAVSRPLTDEITLTELTIAAEAEQVDGGTGRTSRRRREPEAEQTSGLPAKRDLDSLRQQLAKKRTVVRLSGTTTDDVALHRYISKLSGDRLFDKAELLSFESSSADDSAKAEFLLRVVVRKSDPTLANTRSPGARDARRDVEGAMR